MIATIKYGKNKPLLLFLIVIDMYHGLFVYLLLLW